MSFEAWDPDLSLWEEPYTLMSDIKAVTIRADDTAKTFKMYHTPNTGQTEILSRIESGKYYCDEEEVGLKVARNHASSNLAEEMPF